MTSPLRAILYLRQSTYREESISLELQETAGRDYAERQGYVVVGVEQDPGISGRTWKRPAVQRVMAAIEAHEAEVIVLWRWSRLSRSRKDWALAADRVDVAGGRIESATEPNDVTAAGRFARGVMTELAAFESERIGEQWREVHDSRVKHGLPSGRVPWGWVHVDRHAEPHPENSKVIPRMYEMYAAGMGGRQIATWLQENGYRTYYGSADWNHGTVTKILDSPFHSGRISYRGKIVDGEHEALISVAEHDRYLAMREERKNERAAKHTYLLSGILRCGCGAPMFGFAIHHGKRSKASYFGYRCREVSTNPQHGPGTISAPRVDEAFFAWLQSSTELDAPVEPIEEDLGQVDSKRLARQITAIDAQVVALTRQLGEGIVPERAYKATVEELEGHRAALSASLAAVERAVVLAPVDPVGDAVWLIEAWDTESLPVKRAAIRNLVATMTVEFGSERIFTVSPRAGRPVVIAL
jgi:site-specific DNA recombinase